MIRVQAEPFDPAAELAAFQARHPGAGGIVTFLGQVRGAAADGAVSGLELQHYPGVTEREIGRIVEGARGRWPLEGALVIHRTGAMKPGEPIVFVAAAAAHRRAAFEAADFVMDYLKTDAPFWKKETTDDGARWIEPRAQDHADRARWES